MTQPVKVLTNGECAALIYKPGGSLDGAWLDEWCVKFYKDTHLEHADYFTTDEDDAIGTAMLELERMAGKS